MSTLVENPLPIIFIGVIVEAILAVILVQTGRAVILVAMGVVLLIVLAGVGLEWLVVTERERVEATLDAAAAAVEANDLNRVLKHVSASAGKTRRRAAWALDRIEVLDIKLRNLDITVNRLTSPPTAKARFDGTIEFDDRKGQFPYRHYHAPFTVELRLENDRWMITGHSEDHPYGQP